jgi:hypothetical protein
MDTTQKVGPVYCTTKVVELLYDVDLFSAPRIADAPPARDGFVTFFDPGWSILRLRERVVGKGIFYPQTWYDNEPFAKYEDQPRYRQLQMEAVKNSLSKTFAEQQALIPPVAEIPTARVVLTAMVIHFLATGERLFSDYWVRCVDQTSDGPLVFVGEFDPDGVRVNYWFPAYSSDDLGVVLARKF